MIVTCVHVNNGCGNTFTQKHHVRETPFPQNYRVYLKRTPPFVVIYRSSTRVRTDVCGEDKGSHTNGKTRPDQRVTALPTLVDLYTRIHLRFHISLELRPLVTRQ